MSTIDHRLSRRVRACALALPLYAAALGTGSVISPTDSSENADQLRAAAAHGGAWQAAALVELLAAVLLALGVAAIVVVVRTRGRTLATVGGGLGVLGTMGMTLIAARHLFIYGLTATNERTALSVLDRLDGGAGAAALLFMVAGPVALIVLAAAAARAGTAPAWTVAGAIAFFVSDMLPIPEAELVQTAIGVVTFGVIVLPLLRSGTGAGAMRVPGRAPVIGHVDA